MIVCVAISPFRRNSGSPTGLIHLKRSLDHSAACLLLKLRSADNSEGERPAGSVALFVDATKLESDFSVCEEVEEGPVEECLWLAEGSGGL